MAVFSAAEAMEKLKRLSDFNIHSIEQPIATKQWDEMAQLCLDSPIPIALDEELIGIDRTKIDGLLSHINPQYIILKPEPHRRHSIFRKLDPKCRGKGHWMVDDVCPRNECGIERHRTIRLPKRRFYAPRTRKQVVYSPTISILPLYIQRQFMRMHPQHSWNFNALLS